MYAPLHSLQSACQEVHELVVAVLACRYPALVPPVLYIHRRFGPSSPLPSPGSSRFVLAVLIGCSSK